MSRISPFVPQCEPKIMIIGEAPGEQEMKAGRPFVGSSGQLLSDLLHEAQIVRNDCYMTNVFLSRPPGNDLGAWCVKKKEADRLWQEQGHEGKYPMKGIASGKYIRPEFLPEVDRLREEVIAADPNLIIVLGGTPLWALTGSGGITKMRGTVMEVDLGGPRPYKVLPTFHPAYVLRKWDARLIVIADLMKAREEMDSPNVYRPTRELIIEPTLTDIGEFYNYLSSNNRPIAWDIETHPKGGFITCIGFGNEERAICIPFYDTRKENAAYWEDPRDEAEAIHKIRAILHLPNPKITHNGMYDMQWVWKQFGIYPKGELLDTQLLHHSMYPEMRKSLQLLGSLYTNEIAWKTLKPLHQTKGKKDA